MTINIYKQQTPRHLFTIDTMPESSSQHSLQHSKDFKALQNWEARLEKFTEAVEEYEEFVELMYFDGTETERVAAEHRYDQLQCILLGGSDWCTANVNTNLEELRTYVMELGDRQEVKELLSRIDELADEFIDYPADVFSAD